MSDTAEVPAEQRVKVKLSDAVLCLDCDTVYSIRQTTGGGGCWCPDCGSQVRFPVSREIRPLEPQVTLLMSVQGNAPGLPAHLEISRETGRVVKADEPLQFTMHRDIADLRRSFGRLGWSSTILCSKEEP